MTFCENRGILFFSPPASISDLSLMAYSRRDRRVALQTQFRRESSGKTDSRRSAKASGYFTFRLHLPA